MPLPPLPDPRDDQTLVSSINAGSEEAFEVLYFRYRDQVYRWAWRITGDRDDALDVVQETFAYLLNKVPHLKLTARMTTFLYPVVKHNAIRVRQRRRREQAMESPPESGALDAALGGHDDLRDVLRKLPSETREVLLLRFVDDMTLAEIADAQGIPLGTVKSRLHHAITLLRENAPLRRYFEP